MRYTLLALLTACGVDPKVTTRHNVATELAESWCGYIRDCGGSKYSECVDHAVYHLCEYNDSCHQEYESEHLSACLEGIEKVSGNCFYALFNAFPIECREFFKEWDQ